MDSSVIYTYKYKYTDYPREYTDIQSSYAHPLTGMFRGGIEVLARAKIVLSDGVNLQLTVRSTDETIAELITASVG
jgi:coatomer protein complex subunit gamma